MIDILSFVSGAASGEVVGILTGVLLMIWYLREKHGIRIMYIKDLGVKIWEEKDE